MHQSELEVIRDIVTYFVAGDSSQFFSKYVMYSCILTDTKITATIITHLSEIYPLYCDGDVKVTGP